MSSADEKIIKSTNCKICRHDNISREDLCDHVFFDENGNLYHRIKWNNDEKHDFIICPDCHVDVGQFHLNLCDIESCAKCQGQFMSCGCSLTEEEKKEGERFLAQYQKLTAKEKEVFWSKSQ